MSSSSLLTSLLLATTLPCFLVRGENLTDQQPFIIGGEIIAKGEFPFLISVWMDNSVFRCGGTLVDKNVVVTAAHCVTEVNGTPIPSSRLQVRAGDHLRTGADPEEQQRIVTRSVLHPDFSTDQSQSYVNDVAILFTDIPFDLNESVKVIQLSKAGTGSTVGTAMGWGMYEQGNEFASIYPRKVQLNIASDAACTAKFGGDSALQFCAGAQDKGACAGDSGGPFLVGNGGTFYGFLFHGSREQCVGDNVGNLFVRIAPYVDWIQATIKNNNDPGSGDDNDDDGVGTTEAQLITVTSLALLTVIWKFSF